MDEAYNQHSPHTRRHNRSASNLSHLTLAPLTSRLPISDSDDFPIPDQHHVSYIEGRSAPTTPSILSRSSSRVTLKRPAQITLPKSKSSTQLNPRSPRHAPTTPGGTRLKQGVIRGELSISTLIQNDRRDSDWLLRASASIATSTRESKGQAWLVSRASSTSLTGQMDEDEEELQQTLAREREQASRRGSRRGSITTVDADDEFSPNTTRRSLSFGPPTGARSRPHSRYGSRNISRRGSRAQLFTPMTQEREGYFDQRDLDRAELITEPDFVDKDEEELDQEQDQKDDEEVVRRLAKANSNGLGGWVERMLGWSLFSVDEDGEDADTEHESIDNSEFVETGSEGGRRIGEFHEPSVADMPPPNDDDTNGWQDAAWLLSVASKVLL